jgi:hypothetical protein
VGCWARSRRWQRRRSTCEHPGTKLAEGKREAVGSAAHGTLIPTVTGNTVRGFYYARTAVRSQGSSATVTRSDNIQFNSTFCLLWFGPEKALLAGAVSLPTYCPPATAQATSCDGGGGGRLARALVAAQCRGRAGAALREPAGAAGGGGSLATSERRARALAVSRGGRGPVHRLDRFVCHNLDGAVLEKRQHPTHHPLRLSLSLSEATSPTNVPLLALQVNLDIHEQYDVVPLVANDTQTPLSSLSLVD